MHCLMNKTQLAEEQYRFKLKKDKKKLMIKKHRKQKIKVEKIKDDFEKYNHQLRKTKNRTKLQKIAI